MPVTIGIYGGTFDPPHLGEEIRFIDAPQLEISSSVIRSRISNCGHYRYYLLPRVYEYIVQEKLYR